MAGSGTLTDKGFTTKTRKLRGTTLAEVDADRKRNGLVDPNDRSGRFYAATDVTIEVRIGNEVWYPGGMNILRFKAHMNPQPLNPEVIVSATITICVPDKLNSMSSPAKAEWKRFYKAVEKHEKLHVADGRKLAEEMLKEMLKLSAHLETETVNEQLIKKEALLLLEKEAVKKFGGGEIEKRVNAVMKKRDSVDGHGAIKLKHSIV